jgi:hypothetical protein
MSGFAKLHLGQYLNLSFHSSEPPDTLLNPSSRSIHYSPVFFRIDGLVNIVIDPINLKEMPQKYIIYLIVIFVKVYFMVDLGLFFWKLC